MNVSDERNRGTEADRKAKLLSLLREENGWRSGEMLSSLLGISRVAVWKHIRGLKDLGYRVESSSKGYRLIDERDRVSVYDFPDGSGVHFEQVVTSTMDLASEIGSVPHGTVVLAERQTAGRGRMSRRWSSEAGGLYFTVVLRPNVPIAESFRFGFAASVALRAAIVDRTGLECGIKWPNDLLIGGKKVAGILTELCAESGLVTAIFIGIGVNVENAVDCPTAGTLASSGGRATGRIDLLEAFRETLRETLSHSTTTRLFDMWREASDTLGKQVTVVFPDHRVEGIARSVENDGSLVIETHDGSTVTAYYGDLMYGGSDKWSQKTSSGTTTSLVP